MTAPSSPPGLMRRGSPEASWAGWLHPSTPPSLGLGWPLRVWAPRPGSKGPQGAPRLRLWEPSGLGAMRTPWASGQRHRAAPTVSDIEGSAKAVSSSPSWAQALSISVSALCPGSAPSPRLGTPALQPTPTCGVQPWASLGICHFKRAIPLVRLAGGAAACPLGWDHCECLLMAPIHGQSGSALQAE